MINICLDLYIIPQDCTDFQNLYFLRSKKNGVSVLSKGFSLAKKVLFQNLSFKKKALPKKPVVFAEQNSESVLSKGFSLAKKVLFQSLFS